MNIPIDIVSKILLYRSHKEDFKIMLQIINDYQRFLKYNKNITFKKYYFAHSLKRNRY